MGNLAKAPLDVGTHCEDTSENPDPAAFLLDDNHGEDSLNIIWE